MRLGLLRGRWGWSCCWRSVGAGGCTRCRSRRRCRGGPYRPFLTPERISIPDDLEDRSLPKASGKVTLPRHIASSPYSYDLDNRKSLRSCYEQVMTEGLDDDVRFYIDLDVLLDIWDEMWLSPHVRDAWTVWLRGRGLLD